MPHGSHQRNSFTFTLWKDLFQCRRESDSAGNTSKSFSNDSTKVYWTTYWVLSIFKTLAVLWPHGISESGGGTYTLLLLCTPQEEECGLLTHQIQRKLGPGLDQTLWPQASRQSCRGKKATSHTWQQRISVKKKKIIQGKRLGTTSRTSRE